MKNMSILIHTCDDYSWTWPIFFSCLNKHWDYRWPTFFAAEKEYCYLNKGAYIYTGKHEWSERLKIALEYIETDHIIYLQEDFWTLKIEYNYLEAAVDFHINQGAHITKLGTNYEFTYDKISMMGRLPVHKQKIGSPYVMSHQPIAIFDKEYLLKAIDMYNKPCGPSEFEEGVTRLINSGRLHTSAYCIGPMHMPNQSNIWTIEHGVRKGELIPEARNFLVRMGYEAFIPTVW